MTAPSAKGKGENVFCPLSPFPALVPPVFCVLLGKLAAVGVCPGPVFCVATGVALLTLVGVLAIPVAVAVGLASTVGVIVTIAVDNAVGRGVGTGALLTVNVTDALSVGCCPAPAFATTVSEPTELFGIVFEIEKEPLLLDTVEPKL